MSVQVDINRLECPSRRPPTQDGRRLRILYYLFFPGGGIGRYSHELMCRLQRAEGVDTELVCLPSYHWLQQAQYRTWPGLREIGHRNPFRRRLRFLAGQFANPARLIDRARECRADVVHLCNINHLTYAYWGDKLRRTGARIVATAHDVRRAKSIIARGYEERQLRRFYNEADALFVHSRAQADDLREFAGVDPRRIQIVPHGPYAYGSPSGSRDEIRRRLGWPLDKQVALFFGNIRDDKNLHLLLPALRPYRGDVHLVVAGRGSGGLHKGIDFYRRMVKQLELDADVTFHDGYIPDSQIPDLFEACDWVALPYSRSFTSQSGVLNVAAWYRRPVLLSGTPTFAETLTQCRVGLLVAPDDERALSDGIGAIVDAVRTGSPFEFDDYLEQFGWDRNVELTLQVYRRLCG